jgi:hypothetical protein
VGCGTLAVEDASGTFVEAGAGGATPTVPHATEIKSIQLVTNKRGCHLECIEIS